MRAHVVSWHLCNTTQKQPWKREGLGSQWLGSPRDFLTRSRTVLNLSSGRSSSASLGLNTILYSIPKTTDSNKVSECPLCLRVWGTVTSNDISVSKKQGRSEGVLYSLGSAQRPPCFHLTALSCMSHTVCFTLLGFKGCCQGLLSSSRERGLHSFLHWSLHSGWPFMKMSFTPPPSTETAQEVRAAHGGSVLPSPKRPSKPCICLWVSGAFEVTEAGGYLQVTVLEI